MSGHPVEDDAEPGGVTAVDEGAQLIGAAIAAGGGEIAGRLVSPGFVQRVFRNRHQLDMGVAHVGGIGDERVSELGVAIAAAVGMAPPRTGVHFVDIQRRVQPVGARAPLKPLAVAPRILRRLAYPRRRCRAQLETLGVRVGFHHHRTAGAVANFVLVQRAGRQFRHEQFPHPAGAARLQRMHAPVPGIEIADQAHALGIGRPHREAHARDALNRHRPRTQRKIGLVQAAGAEQIQIVVGKGERERIGIEAHARCVPFLEAQPAGRRRAGAEARFEQPGDGPAGKRCPAVGRRHGGCARVRVVGAHAPIVAAAPGAETGVGIVQARLGEQHKLRVGCGCEGGGHGVTRRL